MTDEGAKVLAAAIEKLAAALASGIHVHNYQVMPTLPTGPQHPQQQPWWSPFFVTSQETR